MSFAPLPTHLNHWQTSLQWQPNLSQQDQFAQLYQAILTGNQQLNLTRLTHPEEFWEKHLWDAIAGLLPLEQYLETWNGKAIDVGTGCGIPGLPLAFLHPQLTVTLLDSTQKKIRFLQDLGQSLGWHQVQAIAGRVESLGQDPNYREQFQIALIRAVAAPAVAAEYVLPLLAIGGVAVLYQGQWNEARSRQLEPIVQRLGGELIETVARSTPLTHSQRHWLYLRKIQPTPAQYPRAVGMPTKRPLN
ncbi:MAG: 16S rRNA (guanine(527)-N(7))-methyltransferase RsmG [Spirulina sp. SIO3F2]|nr:16S rRNA (guanine(527)-N(7))-methyltransferase RsmG [Spirulina sp. SIO3F2]